MKRIIEKLFPQQLIFKNHLSILQSVTLFAGLTLIFSLIGTMIPQDGFFAFDWIHFFGRDNIPIFYPPWTGIVVNFLSFPVLVGLTLASVGLASYLRSTHPLSMVAVFLSLPVFWTVFLGQLDGLVLLGTLALPWLSPLALLKPQVSIWAFGARKTYLLGFLITLLISFAVWGWWPELMFSVWTIHEEGKYVNDIAIGFWGLPLAVILLWFSRGDPDMLMLAGTFITPYLLPYNLIVVTPAIARLSPRSAWIACFLSWLPLSANWLGDRGWWLGWLFIFWLWLGLAGNRYVSNTKKVQLSQFFPNLTSEND
ncbi:hypothetical protein [Bellilinea sp.]|uniref:hypothetical protein n=1 Tax=Bellilinea sp. TaxID=2838785 RepID=UPI002ADE479F|nr:hypothetical protein [Bellilinea sp.]